MPSEGPGQPYYRAIEDEVSVFDATYASRQALLIKGPTGCGKSRFIEAMAHAKQRPLFTVACNDETSSTDLVGRWLVRGGDTIWQDGPATCAVRQGGILYLDEVAEAREDVLVVLHALGDHRRTLFLDRTGESIAAHNDFMLVASYNPGYRRSLKELKPSTRQRFVTLSFAYPPPQVEVEIVSREGGVDLAMAKKLVTLARKVRSLTEIALAETASTRVLVAAAKLIKQGLPARLACMTAVVGPLTDDLPTAEALVDLVRLSF